MTTVSVHEAKTHLSRLIAAAERGEEVVISRGQTPVVKLTPLNAVSPRQPRRPGRLKGRGSFDDSFFDPLPENELLLWEGYGD